MATATVAGVETQVTSDNWFQLANQQIAYEQQSNPDLAGSVQSAIISAFRSLGTDANVTADASASSSPILDSYLNTASGWVSDAFNFAVASVVDVGATVADPMNPATRAYKAVVGGIADEAESLGQAADTALLIGQLIVAGALVFGAIYLYRQVRLQHGG